MLDFQTLDHWRNEAAHRRAIKCSFVDRVPIDVFDALLEYAPKSPTLWERIKRACARSPDFIIGPHDDPYLRRWWLLPRNSVFNVYLHHVLRSDDDRALHDHPYWNLSILLKGGYREIVPANVRIGAVFGIQEIKTRAPGAVVFRLGKALHRLEVDRSAPCWSLFITGPRFREWGFQCPKGWVFWKDFVAANPGEIGRGCGEMS